MSNIYDTFKFLCRRSFQLNIDIIRLKDKYDYLETMSLGLHSPDTTKPMDKNSSHRDTKILYMEKKDAVKEQIMRKQAVINYIKSVVDSCDVMIRPYISYTMLQRRQLNELCDYLEVHRDTIRNLIRIEIEKHASISEMERLINMNEELKEGYYD